MMKKKRSLRNEKLRVNRASETEEQAKERLRIEDKTENEKIENHAVHSQAATIITVKNHMLL